MKIALVEDRIRRMENSIGFEIKTVTMIKIITEGHLDDLLSELNRRQTTVFQQYDCILAHRSAFNIEQRDVIKDHCREMKKPLVFFSGGVSSSIFNDEEFPYLHINVKDFYSKNLTCFIEEAQKNNKINLLILQFGVKWKLSLLLSLRNTLILKIQRNSINWIDDISINELIRQEIISKFELPWLQEGEDQCVTNEQVIEFSKKLNELILESI